MLKEGYTLPFRSRPSLTRSPKIINCYVHPHRNLYWLEALHQFMDKDAVEPVQNLWVSSTFLGFKTTQPLETYSRSEQTKQWEWVTSIDFRDAYFHVPIQEQSRTYQISCPGSDIPVQSTVFRSVHCTHGSHCSSKGVETDGHTQGYNNPPVLRRLVGESHIPPSLSPAYTRSNENMRSIRLAGEFRKIGTGTKSRSSTL